MKRKNQKAEILPGVEVPFGKDDCATGKLV